MTMMNQRCVACFEVWPCTSAHLDTHGLDVPMVAPTIKLTTGLCVANFSSPHPFTFTDGSVLPACSKERAQALMLEAREQEVPGIKGTTDIVLKWAMSTEVSEAIFELESIEWIDIIIVPLPVMTVLKAFDAFDVASSKCRVIRTADRITKTIHHDRFCR